MIVIGQLSCVGLVFVGQLVFFSVDVSVLLNVVFCVFVLVVLLLQVWIIVLLILILVSVLVGVVMFLQFRLVFVSVFFVMLYELVNFDVLIGLNWNEQVVGLVMIVIGVFCVVSLSCGFVQCVSVLNSGKQVSVVIRQLVRMIGLWLILFDSELKNRKNGVLIRSVIVIRMFVLVLLIFSVCVRKNSVQNWFVYYMIVWLVVRLISVRIMIFRFFYWLNVLVSGVFDVLFFVLMCRNIGDLFSCSWIYIDILSSRIDVMNGMCQF